MKDSEVLYVVRHAPPSTSGICYGQSDVPVSLSAEEAAERVLRQMPYSIERLYCSPSKRTHSLAVAIAARTELEVIVDTRLYELHFGNWEGRTWNEIFETEREALEAWAAQPLRSAPPGGECGRALVERLLSFVTTTDWVHALLVCHAGPIRALRALGSLPTENRRSENVPQLDFDRPVLPLDVEGIPWVRSGAGQKF